MAIGLGKMFGFDFMENFNLPYISKSITEFWRDGISLCLRGFEIISIFPWWETGQGTFILICCWSLLLRD